MRFTPRLPEENVNVSKISPLKELFLLLTAIMGTLVVVYLILGFALDLMILRMPERADAVLASVFRPYASDKKEVSPAQAKVQHLLDELVTLTPVAGIVMSILLLAFPIVLGDVNASGALLSSLGMIAVVLLTYYLRMIKREIDFDRLRVAVGGICLGVGVIMLVMAPSITPLSVFPIMVFVGIITIIAGLLNIVASAHKPN